MNKELYISNLEEVYIEEYQKYKNTFEQTDTGQETFSAIASYIDVLHNVPDNKYAIISATDAFFGIMIYSFATEREEIMYKLNNMVLSESEKNSLLKKNFELAALNIVAVYIKNMAKMSVPIDDFIADSEKAKNISSNKNWPTNDFQEYLDEFHCCRADILMLENIIGKLGVFDDVMGRELKKRNNREWRF